MPAFVYPFGVDASGLVYTFESGGIRTLTKKVIFTELNPRYFNVELRTEEESGLLPDTENSNNGDVYAVLRTCAAIIQDFLNTNPDKAVYIRGSDGRRQRRYERMLSTALDGDKFLKVFGELADGTAEPFETGTVYEACLVFLH